MSETRGRRICASPRAKHLAEVHNIPFIHMEGSGPNGRIIENDVFFYMEQQKRLTTPKEKKIKSTSLAKAIAEAEQIDLNRIAGTGLHGKITSFDVLQLKRDVTLSRPSEDHRSSQPIPLSGMRKIIAERMAYSTQTAPHVTLTTKLEVTKLVEYRNKWAQEGIKLSYTDIFVKIAAQCLREHPLLNVSLEEGMLVKHQDCHIGVAVALDDGLIVPVIRDADRRKLSEISKDLKDKVHRSRQGKLRMEELRDGRFTISNLGMFEVDAFTPIINLPESAILGIGRIAEDLIVQNGQIHIGKTMVQSISFDHRVVDGAPAALFLTSMKKLLENPEYLQNHL